MTMADYLWRVVAAEVISLTVPSGSLTLTAAVSSAPAAGGGETTVR